MTQAPLRTFRYRLSTRDALAWEALPREPGPGAKLAFLAALIVGASLLALLPEDWLAGWNIVLAMGMLVLFLFAASLPLRALAARWRARRRIPGTLQVTLEDWGDSLRVIEPQRTWRLADATSFVNDRSAGHLFLIGGREVLIVPDAVFAPGERAALVQRIERAGRDPEDMTD